PLEFLRRHPPFDRLGERDLRRVDDALEISFAPRGELVLRRGGAGGEHLFVVRKGAVRLERDGQLLRALEEGDCFGHPSLIGRAARLMRSAGTDALLVAGAPPGILTDRDLRTRVLAEGHGPELPVERAMTRPALTLPAGASLFEVLLFMLDHHVHHAPLEE